ncbi:hypothetical protein E0E54_08875 [Azotobacter chroococcum]|jgi:hypothetical protein|uniref:Uncharacterized protein n=1 Tax=Azotobacter chroococcum TaxID=353 RepID=A0A4R1PZB9_9GAMM|nr:hypothetical protein [Azotobacter chroococcum]NHN76991.1 hypothetical protein [Azotobacter chroococcum]TBV93489.1 hypothetical protein E0E53_16430 [Azotobacter chroococcum]TBW36702.1 hypothetical protein E0E54_08875 [Azotobacter chroococcum]TCL33364.1 hypothetical protein EV691_10438 [Azotobacter chroococcum]
MITQATYHEATANTRWMLNCIRNAKNVDLSTVQVFIAPLSGISALRGGNPAIYVRNNQMQIAVGNWRTEMQSYAQANSAEHIPHDRINRGTCIIASESIFGWPLSRRCGVLWHEYGHAYNERVGRPNTEQNAYLFEVDMFDYASTTNVFRDNGIGVAEVLDYLNWRQPYFDKGITPQLTQLLASLRAKLGAMARHNFMAV